MGKKDVKLAYQEFADRSGKLYNEIIEELKNQQIKQFDTIEHGIEQVEDESHQETLHWKLDKCMHLREMANDLLWEAME